MRIKDLFDTKRRVAVVVLSGAALMASAGVAAAYFSAGTGTGTGTVNVATAQVVTVGSGGSSSTLTPADPVTLTFQISNPNTYAVHFAAPAVTAVVQAPSTECDITAAIVGTPGTSLAASTHETVTVQVSIATNPALTQDLCHATVTLKA